MRFCNVIFLRSSWANCTRARAVSHSHHTHPASTSSACTATRAHGSMVRSFACISICKLANTPKTTLRSQPKTNSMSFNCAFVSCLIKLSRSPRSKTINAIEKSDFARQASQQTAASCGGRSHKPPFLLLLALGSCVISKVSSRPKSSSKLANWVFDPCSYATSC